MPALGAEPIVGGRSLRLFCGRFFASALPVWPRPGRCLGLVAVTAMLAMMGSLVLSERVAANSPAEELNLSLQLVSGSAANWSVTQERDFTFVIVATNGSGNRFDPPPGTLELSVVTPAGIDFDPAQDIIGGRLLDFTAGVSSRTLRFERLSNFEGAIQVSVSPVAGGLYDDSAVTGPFVQAAIAVLPLEIMRLLLVYEVLEQQQDAVNPARFQISVRGQDANGLSFNVPSDQLPNLRVVFMLQDTAGNGYRLERDDLARQNQFTFVVRGYNVSLLWTDLFTDEPLPPRGYLQVADGFELIATASDPAEVIFELRDAAGQSVDTLTIDAVGVGRVRAFMRVLDRDGNGLVLSPRLIGALKLELDGHSGALMQVRVLDADTGQPPELSAGGIEFALELSVPPILLTTVTVVAENYADFSSARGQLRLERAAATRLVSGERLSIGINFLCGLNEDGTVHCGGDGHFNGGVTDSRSGSRGEYAYQLFQVLDADSREALSGVVALGQSVSSSQFNCALLRDGEVACWGRVGGFFAEVGLDQMARRLPGLKNVLQLSLGVGFGCALVGRDGDDGGTEIWCWGNNRLAQAGADPQSVRTVPVPQAAPGLASLRGVVQLAAGAEHVCALRADGRVFCWGYNGGPARLLGGDASLIRSMSPVEVAVGDVVQLAAGGQFSCALSRPQSGEEDGIWCWGSGYSKDDSLPGGSTDGVSPILGITSIPGARLRQLAVAGPQGCALLADGDLWCWRDNGDSTAEGDWVYGNDFDVSGGGRRALCSNGSAAAQSCPSGDTVLECLNRGDSLDDVRAGRCDLLLSGTEPNVLEIVATAADRLLLHAALFYADRNVGISAGCLQTDESCISGRISLLTNTLNLDHGARARTALLNWLAGAGRAQAVLATRNIARPIARTEDARYYQHSTGALAVGVVPLSDVLEVQLFGTTSINGAAGGCALRRDSTLWCWGLDQRQFWTSGAFSDGSVETQYTLDDSRVDDLGREIGYRYAASIIPWDRAGAVRAWTEIGIDFFTDGSPPVLLDPPLAELTGRDVATNVRVRIIQLAGPPDEFGQLRPIYVADNAVTIGFAPPLPSHISVGFELGPGPFQIESADGLSLRMSINIGSSYPESFFRVGLQTASAIGEPDVLPKTGTLATWLGSEPAARLASLSLRLVSGSADDWNAQEQRSFSFEIEARDNFGYRFDPPSGALELSAVTPAGIGFDADRDITGGRLLEFSGGVSSRILRFTRSASFNGPIRVMVSPAAGSLYTDSPVAMQFVDIAVSEVEWASFLLRFEVIEQQRDVANPASFSVQVFGVDANDLQLALPPEEAMRLGLRIRLGDDSGNEYLLERDDLSRQDPFTFVVLGNDLSVLSAELIGASQRVDIDDNGFELLATDAAPAALVLELRNSAGQRVDTIEIDGAGVGFVKVFMRVLDANGEGLAVGAELAGALRLELGDLSGALLQFERSGQSDGRLPSLPASGRGFDFNLSVPPILLTTVTVVAGNYTAFPGGRQQLQLVRAARHRLTSGKRLSIGPDFLCGLNENGIVRCGGASGVNAGTEDSRSGARRGEYAYQAFEVLDGESGEPLSGVVALGQSVSSPPVSCALLRDGDVACWGQPGPFGGIDLDRSARRLLGLNNVLQLSLGADFGCALVERDRDEGGTEIWCWGDNRYGQAGEDPQRMQAVATPRRASSLASLRGVVQLDAGADHACALQVDGRVFCWGHNGGATGLLGGETAVISSTTPVEVAVGDVVQIAAGEQFSCALTRLGEEETDDIWCWGGGYSQNDVLLNGLPSRGSAIIGFSAPGARLRQLTVAGPQGCALTDSGVLWCWRDSAVATLGDSWIYGNDFAVGGGRTARCFDESGRVLSCPSGEAVLECLNQGSSLTDVRSGRCALLPADADPRTLEIITRATDRLVLYTALFYNNFPRLISSLFCDRTTEACISVRSLWAVRILNFEVTEAVRDRLLSYLLAEDRDRGQLLGGDRNIARQIASTDDARYYLGSAEAMAAGLAPLIEVLELRLFGTRTIAGETGGCALRRDSSLWCWGSGRQQWWTSGVFVAGTTETQLAVDDGRLTGPEGQTGYRYAASMVAWDRTDAVRVWTEIGFRFYDTVDQDREVAPVVVLSAKGAESSVVVPYRVVQLAGPPDEFGELRPIYVPNSLIAPIEIDPESVPSVRVNFGGRGGVRPSMGDEPVPYTPISLIGSEVSTMFAYLDLNYPRSFAAVRLRLSPWRSEPDVLPRTWRVGVILASERLDSLSLRLVSGSVENWSGQQQRDLVFEVVATDRFGYRFDPPSGALELSVSVPSEFDFEVERDLIGGRQLDFSDGVARRTLRLTLPRNSKGRIQLAVTPAEDGLYSGSAASATLDLDIPLVAIASFELVFEVVMQQAEVGGPVKFRISLFPLNSDGQRFDALLEQFAGIGIQAMLQNAGNDPFPFQLDRVATRVSPFMGFYSEVFEGNIETDLSLVSARLLGTSLPYDVLADDFRLIAFIDAPPRLLKLGLTAAEPSKEHPATLGEETVFVITLSPEFTLGVGPAMETVELQLDGPAAFLPDGGVMPVAGDSRRATITLGATASEIRVSVRPDPRSETAATLIVIDRRNTMRYGPLVLSVEATRTVPAKLVLEWRDTLGQKAAGVLAVDAAGGARGRLFMRFLDGTGVGIALNTGVVGVLGLALDELNGLPSQFRVQAADSDRFPPLPASGGEFDIVLSVPPILLTTLTLVVSGYDDLPGSRLQLRLARAQTNRLVSGARLSLGPNVLCGLNEDGTVRCGGAAGVNGGAEASRSGNRGAYQYEVFEVQDADSGTALNGVVALGQLLSSPPVSCALLRAGDVACWGQSGSFGGIALDGSARRLPGLRNVLQLSLGADFGCALVGRADNTGGTAIWCWGDNRFGQAGEDPQRLPTVAAPGVASALTSLRGVIQLDAGADHACALLADGRVFCWGRNGGAAGLLGADASVISSMTPVEVAVGDVVQIAAGERFSCAVARPGVGEEDVIWCWGGGYSQDEALFGGLSPIHGISSPSGIRLRQLAVAGPQGCALTDSGALWCWRESEVATSGDSWIYGNDFDIGGSGRMASCFDESDVVQPCPSQGLLADRNIARQLARTEDARYYQSSTAALTVGVAPLSEVLELRLFGARASAGGDTGGCALRRDSTLWCWGGGAQQLWTSGVFADGTTETQFALDDSRLGDSGRQMGYRYAASMVPWDRSDALRVWTEIGIDFYTDTTSTVLLDPPVVELSDRDVSETVRIRIVQLAGPPDEAGKLRPIHVAGNEIAAIVFDPPLPSGTMGLSDRVVLQFEQGRGPFQIESAAGVSQNLVVGFERFYPDSSILLGFRAASAHVEPDVLPKTWPLGLVLRSARLLDFSIRHVSGDFENWNVGEERDITVEILAFDVFGYRFEPPDGALVLDYLFPEETHSPTRGGTISTRFSGGVFRHTFRFQRPQDYFLSDFALCAVNPNWRTAPPLPSLGRGKNFECITIAYPLIPVSRLQLSFEVLQQQMDFDAEASFQVSVLGRDANGQPFTVFPTHLVGIGLQFKLVAADGATEYSFESEKLSPQNSFTVVLDRFDATVLSVELTGAAPPPVDIVADEFRLRAFLDQPPFLLDLTMTAENPTREHPELLGAETIFVITLSPEFSFGVGAPMATLDLQLDTAANVRFLAAAGVVSVAGDSHRAVVTLDGTARQIRVSVDPDPQLATTVTLTATDRGGVISESLELSVGAAPNALAELTMGWVSADSMQIDTLELDAAGTAHGSLAVVVVDTDDAPQSLGGAALAALASELRLELDGLSGALLQTRLAAEPMAGEIDLIEIELSLPPTLLTTLTLVAGSYAHLPGSRLQFRIERAQTNRLVSGARLSLGPDFLCGLNEDGTVRCGGVAGANGGAEASRSGNRGAYQYEVFEVQDADSGKALGGVVALGQSVSSPPVSCALLRDGDVSCWGQSGSFGGIALDGLARRLPGLKNVLQLSLGADFGCALVGRAEDTGGTEIWCWGDNRYGQAGEDPQRLPTVTAPGAASALASLRGVVQLDAGADHACALRVDGRVFCWGRNGGAVGLLGADASVISSTTPVEVAVGDVAQIAVGERFSCAVARPGAGEEDDIWCWGGGYSEDETLVGGLSPIHGISSPSGLRQLAVAGPQGCALTDSGALWCWRESEVATSGDSWIYGNDFDIGGGRMASCFDESDGVQPCPSGDVVLECLNEGNSLTEVRAGRCDLLPVDADPSALAITGAAVDRLLRYAALFYVIADNSEFEAGCERTDESCISGRILLLTGILNLAADASPRTELLSYLSGVEGDRALLADRNIARQLARTEDARYYQSSTAALTMGVVPLSEVLELRLFGTRAIAGGDTGGCALRRDSTLWCWGGGAQQLWTSGFLADGTTETQFALDDRRLGDSDRQMGYRYAVSMVPWDRSDALRVWTEIAIDLYANLDDGVVLDPPVVELEAKGAANLSAAFFGRITLLAGPPDKAGKLRPIYVPNEVGPLSYDPPLPAGVTIVTEIDGRTLRLAPPSDSANAFAAFASFAANYPQPFVLTGFRIPSVAAEPDVVSGTEPFQVVLRSQRLGTVSLRIVSGYSLEENLATWSLNQDRYFVFEVEAADRFGNRFDPPAGSLELRLAVRANPGFVAEYEIIDGPTLEFSAGVTSRTMRIRRGTIGGASFFGEIHATSGGLYEAAYGGRALAKFLFFFFTGPKLERFQVIFSALEQQALPSDPARYRVSVVSVDANGLPVPADAMPGMGLRFTLVDAIGNEYPVVIDDFVFSGSLLQFERSIVPMGNNIRLLAAELTGTSVPYDVVADDFELTAIVLPLPRLTALTLTTDNPARKHPNNLGEEVIFVVTFDIDFTAGTGLPEVTFDLSLSTADAAFLPTEGLLPVAGNNRRATITLNERNSQIRISVSPNPRSDTVVALTASARGEAISESLKLSVAAAPALPRELVLELRDELGQKTTAPLFLDAAGGAQGRLFVRVLDPAGNGLAIGAGASGLELRLGGIHGPLFQSRVLTEDSGLLPALPAAGVEVEFALSVPPTLLTNFTLVVENYAGLAGSSVQVLLGRALTNRLVSGKRLSIGADFVCGLNENGTVRCGGAAEMNGGDADSRSGSRGAYQYRAFEVLDADSGDPLGGVVALGQSVSSPPVSCALLRDGTVACWGQSGTTFAGIEIDHMAQRLPGLQNVMQLSLGAGFGCALVGGGTIALGTQIWCWGDNRYGQAGVDPDDMLTVATPGAPPAFGNLRGVVQVDTGAEHACALLADGRVVCWGNADLPERLFGRTELLAGSISATHLPTQVAVSNAVQIAVGERFSCALSQSGSGDGGDIWCWGGAYSGDDRLHDGLPNRVSLIVGLALPPEGQLRQLTVAGPQGCALTAGGKSWCWRENGAADSADSWIYGNDVDRDGGRVAACFTRSGAELPCPSQGVVLACLAQGDLLDDIRSGRCALLPAAEPSVLAIVGAEVDRLLLAAALFYVAIDAGIFAGCGRTDAPCITERTGVLAVILNSAADVPARTALLRWFAGADGRGARIPTHNIARQLGRAEDARYYQSSTSALTAALVPLAEVLELRLFGTPTDAGDTGGCALRRDSTLWCWGSVRQQLWTSGVFADGTTETQFTADDDRLSDTEIQTGYRYAASMVPWDRADALRVWTKTSAVIELAVGGDGTELRLIETVGQSLETDAVRVEIELLAGPPDEFGKLRPIVVPGSGDIGSFVPEWIAPEGLSVNPDELFFRPVWRFAFSSDYPESLAAVELRVAPRIAEPDVSVTTKSLLVVKKLEKLAALSLRLVAGNTENWSVTQQRSFGFEIRAFDYLGELFRPASGMRVLALQVTVPDGIDFAPDQDFFLRLAPTPRGPGALASGSERVVFAPEDSVARPVLRFRRSSNIGGVIKVAVVPDPLRSSSVQDYKYPAEETAFEFEVVPLTVAGLQAVFAVTEQQRSADAPARFQVSLIAVDANGQPLSVAPEQFSGVGLRGELIDTVGNVYPFASDNLVAENLFSVVLQDYDAMLRSAELTGTARTYSIVAAGFVLIAADRLGSVAIAVTPPSRQQQTFGQSVEFTATVQLLGTRGGVLGGGPSSKIRLYSAFADGAFSWTPGDGTVLAFSDGVAVVDIAVTPLIPCNSSPCRSEALEFLLLGATAGVSTGSARVEVTAAPVLDRVVVVSIPPLQEAYQGAPVAISDPVIVAAIGLDGSPFVPQGASLRLFGTDLRISDGRTRLPILFGSDGRATLDISDLRLFLGDQGMDGLLHFEVTGESLQRITTSVTTVRVLAAPRVATLTVSFSAAELQGTTWMQREHGDPLVLTVEIVARDRDGQAVDPINLGLRLSGEGIVPLSQDIPLDFAGPVVGTTAVVVVLELADQGADGMLQSAVLLFDGSPVAAVAMPPVAVQVPEPILLRAVEFVDNVVWPEHALNRDVLISPGELNLPKPIRRRIELRGAGGGLLRWSEPDSLVYQLLGTTLSIVIPDDDDGVYDVNFVLQPRYFPAVGSSRTFTPAGYRDGGRSGGRCGKPAGPALRRSGIS